MAIVLISQYAGPAAQGSPDAVRPDCRERARHRDSGRQHAVLAVDPEPPAPRPPIDGHRSADLVVVVGASLSRLWTAVRAKERDPDRRRKPSRAPDRQRGGRNGGFVAASITHGHALATDRSVAAGVLDTERDGPR